MRIPLLSKKGSDKSGNKVGLVRVIVVMKYRFAWVLSCGFHTELNRLKKCAKGDALQGTVVGVTMDIHSIRQDIIPLHTFEENSWGESFFSLSLLLFLDLGRVCWKFVFQRLSVLSIAYVCVHIVFLFESLLESS